MMTLSSGWHTKYITSSLLAFLFMPSTAGFASTPSSLPDNTERQITSTGQAQPKASDSLLAKPGKDTDHSTLEYPENPAPRTSFANGQSSQSDALQTAPQPLIQPTSNVPVGTAAAPQEKPAGATATRPAGAVIAPAKQRRARFILIRVGVIAGAAVAIGTVVLLSSASPSRSH